MVRFHANGWCSLFAMESDEDLMARAGRVELALFELALEDALLEAEQESSSGCVFSTLDAPALARTALCKRISDLATSAGVDAPWVSVSPAPLTADEWHISLALHAQQRIATLDAGAGTTATEQARQLKARARACIRSEEEASIGAIRSLIDARSKEPQAAAAGSMSLCPVCGGAAATSPLVESSAAACHCGCSSGPLLSAMKPLQLAQLLSARSGSGALLQSDAGPCAAADEAFAALLRPWAPLTLVGSPLGAAGGAGSPPGFASPASTGGGSVSGAAAMPISGSGSSASALPLPLQRSKSLMISRGGFGADAIASTAPTAGPAGPLALAGSAAAVRGSQRYRGVFAPSSLREGGLSAIMAGLPTAASSSSLVVSSSLADSRWTATASSSSAAAPVGASAAPSISIAGLPPIPLALGPASMHTAAAGADGQDTARALAAAFELSAGGEAALAADGDLARGRRFSSSSADSEAAASGQSGGERRPSDAEGALGITGLADVAVAGGEAGAASTSMLVASPPGALINDYYDSSGGGGGSASAPVATASPGGTGTGIGALLRGSRDRDRDSMSRSTSHSALPSIAELPAAPGLGPLAAASPSSLRAAAADAAAADAAAAQRERDRELEQQERDSDPSEGVSRATALLSAFVRYFLLLTLRVPLHASREVHCASLHVRTQGPSPAVAAAPSGPRGGAGSSATVSNGGITSVANSSSSRELVRCEREPSAAAACRWPWGGAPAPSSAPEATPRHSGHHGSVGASSDAAAARDAKEAAEAAARASAFALPRPASPAMVQAAADAAALVGQHPNGALLSSAALLFRSIYGPLAFGDTASPRDAAEAALGRDGASVSRSSRRGAGKGKPCKCAKRTSGASGSGTGVESPVGAGGETDKASAAGEHDDDGHAELDSAAAQTARGPGHWRAVWAAARADFTSLSRALTAALLSRYGFLVKLPVAPLPRCPSKLAAIAAQAQPATPASATAASAASGAGLGLGLGLGMYSSSMLSLAAAGSSPASPGSAVASPLPGSGSSASVGAGAGSSSLGKGFHAANITNTTASRAWEAILLAAASDSSNNSGGGDELTPARCAAFECALRTAHHGAGAMDGAAGSGKGSSASAAGAGGHAPQAPPLLLRLLLTARAARSSARLSRPRPTTLSGLPLSPPLSDAGSVGGGSVAGAGAGSARVLVGGGPSAAHTRARSWEAGSTASGPSVTSGAWGLTGGAGPSGWGGDTDRDRDRDRDDVSSAGGTAIGSVGPGPSGASAAASVSTANMAMAAAAGKASGRRIAAYSLRLGGSSGSGGHRRNHSYGSAGSGPIGSGAGSSLTVSWAEAASRGISSSSAAPSGKSGGGAAGHAHLEGASRGTAGSPGSVGGSVGGSFSMMGPLHAQLHGSGSGAGAGMGAGVGVGGGPVAVAGPSQFADLTEAVLGTASDALFAAVRDVLSALCARAGAEAAPAAARAAARKAAGRASLKGAPAGLPLPPPSPPLPRSPGGPAGRSASAAVLAPAAWNSIVAALADKPPACFGLPPDGPTLDGGGVDGTTEGESEGSAAASAATVAAGDVGAKQTTATASATGGVSTAAALWPAVVALEALPLQACVSGKLRVLLKTMHAIHSGVALQRAAAAAAAAADAAAAAAAEASEAAAVEGAAAPAAPAAPAVVSDAIPPVAPAALAADDLLPRLCWVLSRASCPQLPAELALVEELLPPQHAMTELGYAATMARSAMLAAASMAQ